MKTDRKVLNYEQAQRAAQRLHRQGRTVVLTSGCYDLLHLGHIQHLEYCRSKGDVLIVNVGNDETVRKIKGEDRPVFAASVRARMLAALECTDIIIISEEAGKMDHVELVRRLRPNIYVVNQTDSHIKEKSALVKENGGKLLTCRRVPPVGASGISTTAITRRLPRS